jgi:hypothetical protein
MRWDWEEVAMHWTEAQGVSRSTSLKIEMRCELWQRFLQFSVEVSRKIVSCWSKV